MKDCLSKPLITKGYLPIYLSVRNKIYMDDCYYLVCAKQFALIYLRFSKIDKSQN